MTDMTQSGRTWSQTLTNLIVLHSDRRVYRYVGGLFLWCYHYGQRQECKSRRCIPYALCHVSAVAFTALTHRAEQAKLNERKN